MGFLDKVRDKAAQLKEENRNFGTTTKRINDKRNFYGNINRGVKDGDFWEGSYVSLENDNRHAVIYGNNQDDYRIFPGDVVSCKLVGDGPNIPYGDQRVVTMRYTLTFKDGKTAQADLITDKIDAFKSALGI